MANFLDLEMLAMELSKEICNRIKNTKVSEMTFNTIILLMLVIHSRKTINKQIFRRRNNHIIEDPVWDCISDSNYVKVNWQINHHLCFYNFIRTFPNSI